MRVLLALLAVTILTIKPAMAFEKFVGTWHSGGKEILAITREGSSFHAEFFRKNVKSRFENVRFPATIQNGVFVISGDLGDVTAEYDESKKVLILGGLKPFKRLTTDEAAARIAQLEKLPSQ